MAFGENRIKKLEDTLFAGLPPAGRVCELVKALADGNKDLADRLAATCPRRDYRMMDAAYGDRVDKVILLCKAAAATFDKYAFACLQIEGLKDFLIPKTRAVASLGTSRAVEAATRDMIEQLRSETPAGRL